MNNALRISIIRAMSTNKPATHPAPVSGRNFQVALVQLGETSPDKALNLQHARELALKAAKGSKGSEGVQLIVLPECFNSLYGTGRHELEDP